MSDAAEKHAPARVALLGNPNTGKTTLFNRLCGLRHKTSNYAGTTQEARLGRLRVGVVEIIDLPGVYSLELDQSESEVCRKVLAGELAPVDEIASAPDAVCVVLDSTNIARNFMMLGEALRRRLPTVVVLNMSDLAQRRGITVDAAGLESDLGVPVIAASARTGEGCEQIEAALQHARVSIVTPPGTIDGLEAWADGLFAKRVSITEQRETASLTDRLDRIFTHSVGGLLSFILVMSALFYVIFTLASYPMDFIESAFGSLAEIVGDTLPPGLLNECVTDGVIGGVGATVVFLPQICLLFFIISLLEDTGYLSRAAFVMDRLLRPFGLSGHAFVPLLSSHACALPGIMAARAVPDPKDRLATILVAPFMSCSARIPVYALLTFFLFPESPAKQTLAFIGCYALGIAAGVVSALVARRTILGGSSRRMALELPTYKRPSLRTAFMSTWDRGTVFMKKAATNILAISVVLWWLSAFPKVEPPNSALVIRESVATLQDSDLAPKSDVFDGETAAAWRAEAERLERSHAVANSFAADLGRIITPVFSPMDYDWRLCVGLVTSFAAREVFVSTLGVVASGHDDTEDGGVRDAIHKLSRDDGVTPVFNDAVIWSLLVYYVLAMQCLPTLAVTAREAGGWRWAMLQLGWMSALAYLGALIAHGVVA